MIPFVHVGLELHVVLILCILVIKLIIFLPGAKTVSLFSSGNHKAKITVMLTAMADGRKLRPYIVFKGKKIPKELRDFKDAVIAVSDNGWMNETTTLDWLKRCWGTFSFGRRLLVWDAFRAHRTYLVKKQLNSTRTDTAMIPGGCTSLLQAPDVSWNKPFKAAYLEQYEAWARTIGVSEANRTNAGNPRPPTKLTMCTWVVAAWNSIQADLIKKSFYVCGLTTPLDGSGDSEIHAVKELAIQPNDLRTVRKATEFDIEDDVCSSSDESVVLCDDSSDSSVDDSETE